MPKLITKKDQEKIIVMFEDDFAIHEIVKETGRDRKSVKKNH